MKRLIGGCGLAVILGAGLMTITPSAAQGTCLHGPGESPEQAARRRQAVGFARQVHNAQLKAHQSTRAYLSGEQISSTSKAPEGFEFRLSSDAGGYAFSVVDKSDPCRFGYFSNEQGLIYKGEPLQ